MAVFRSGRPRGEAYPLAANLAGLAVLALFTSLPVLLPVPRPEPPRGPEQVGTRTFFFTDESREDPFASEPGAPRELVVQIWFPAEPGPNTNPAPWMEEAEQVAPAISEFLGLPGFFLDHLVFARTHSYKDAPIAAAGEPFPVVVFSHGYGGFRAQNTFQVQELASRGYIVIGIEHTYAAVLTVFPDGREAPFNPDTLPEDVGDAEFREATRVLLEQWTGDIGFVLDELARLNEDSRSDWNERIDLNAVGLLGHSTGGRAALQFCKQDTRCKAGLAMDPWVLDDDFEAFASGPDQPFLLLYSEGWSSGPGTERFDRYAQGFDGDETVYSITGSRHYDFSDLPALSPLAPYIGLKGPIPADRVLDILLTYTLEFFDRELLGEEIPHMGGPDARFPELVDIET